MNLRHRSGFMRTLTILNLFLNIFWAFYSLRFSRILHGSAWIEDRRRELYVTQARRFRLTAVELGGLLIKLGQFFSTRVDILPQDSIRELSGLQDEVRPEKYADIKELIEKEFAQPINQVFKMVEEEPVASASLGQVHRGELPSGATVALKVQRPGIDRLVEIDLGAVARVVRLIKLFTDWDKFIDLDAIYHEFAETIRAELDYIQEGHNAETIAANSSTDGDIIVPSIFWDYTRPKVLTMEFLEGIKVSELDALQAAGIDRQKLAAKLLDTYVKQVLIDGFYHADPHPGNLFASPEGKLIMVDFGMVGTIAPSLRNTLLQMAFALVKRDFPSVLIYLQEIGFIRYNAESEALIRAMAVFIEQFLGSGQDLSSPDLKSFLQDLETLLYEQPFQIPANFTFLGRALGTLYGICIGLDPEISFLDVARPYVEKVAPGKASIFNLVKDKSSRWALSLVELPSLAEDFLRKAERGDLTVKVPLKTINESIDNNTRAVRMVAWALVFGFSMASAFYLLVNGWENIARYTFIFSGLVFVALCKNSRSPGVRQAPHPPVMVKRGRK